MHRASAAAARGEAAGRGGVASGGIGFALFGRALAEHLDLHSVVTTGNEADLEVLDFVEHLVGTGEAGVILLFIEGLKDARRLAAVAAKAAAKQVAIVVKKVGRSAAGQRAALSHTAHLAGADAAYDAVFERHGVIRVFDAEEMLAVGAALLLMPLMQGGRTAVVTTSGGAGGWAADLLSAQGLELPTLSESLQRRIMEYLPPYASAGNPVDTTVAAPITGAGACSARSTPWRVPAKWTRSSSIWASRPKGGWRAWLPN